jgi:hypothetical protein
MAVTTDERGTVSYCHRCQYVATEHLERRPNIAPARTIARAKPLDWSTRAELIWRQTQPLRGTFGETYLHHRGCMLPLTNSALILSLRRRLVSVPRRCDGCTVTLPTESPPTLRHCRPCWSWLRLSHGPVAMSAATLLDRLDRVKQTRPHNHVAACPCCQSGRGRPISLRVLDDGRVLLHPFCGCETGDVLAVLGLSITDLFPEPLPARSSAVYPPSHSSIPARDLLDLLSEETTVVALIAAALLACRAIDGATWRRLATAASRIHHARDFLNGR